jgi:hypothetical protein
MYQRDLADFVEKKGPAVGVLKSSDTVTQRAGEGALGMAEKLALEKFRRDRPAVDTDERLLAPRAALVNGRGDELLASAGFSQDQHGGIGRRDHLDLFEDAAQGGTAADDLAKG